MLLLKSSSQRSLVFLCSKTRVPRTLHVHARRYSNESPPFTRHHVSYTTFTSNHTKPDPPEEISDLEWEIRTAPSLASHVNTLGRAIYILEQTLPDFFHVGLVSNIDPTRPEIVNAPLDDSDNIESIYSPTIRLTYTPPAALPPPFPRTLSLEGLPLYMASSAFIRHTMKTLCSDLRVEMRKLIVHTPSSTLPQTSLPGVTQPRKREKSLLVGLAVYGTTRVSGGLGEWQVDSTYWFSPVSGLINLHTIDSIQPAPHQTAYDALLTCIT